MTSRLFREVREKRGLAYTVFGTFYSLEHGAYFYGGTTTKNERARESFDVAQAEIRDVALNGLNRGGTGEGQDLSHRLLSAALRHLRQDRVPACQSSSTASAELACRAQCHIAAVTMEDCQRGAKRLLGDGDLLVTVVGKPAGV